MAGRFENLMESEKFGKYNLYKLKNEFLEVDVIDYGATIISIKYKEREQILNYKDDAGYENDESYIAAVIGRYANRIGNSRFVLDGKEICVAPNEGKNHAHGGPNPFSKRVWNIDTDGTTLKATINSADGDNGYPGNLTMCISYTIVGSTLHVEFDGETDGLTVFAPTIHPYFVTDGSCLKAKARINAVGHLEVDSELIPTGTVLPCEGKFDFSSLRELGEEYDDCFVTPDDYCITFDTGYSTVEMRTDFPAMQIYTGQGLTEPFEKYSAVAIEPEFYPDSPNKKEFPSTELRPGEKFHKYCDYIFN